MTIPNDILDALRRGGLVAPRETPAFTALTGGVSSDIWRVDLKTGPICVKRALAKLKVADNWEAPVSRNAYEVAWMQAAQAIVPDCTPEIILHDPDGGLFAMAYLDAGDYPLWKAQLRDGIANADDAAAVGATLGKIHAATSQNKSIPPRFATDDIFHAIRLEPYLLATGVRRPEVAGRLKELADITAAHRLALVHGDISPKNILIGADGPVFLDAECAWYGDPAFDLAFCLNHLLLKCLWTPSARPGFKACFEALCHAYEHESVAINDPAVLSRTAHLLPGLLLGRIDGKSPVEYVTDENVRNLVRDFARQFLTMPVNHPIDISNAWQQHLDND
jgi:tRNA A-37 threonylcarbamoyl transferase component Bud32